LDENEFASTPVIDAINRYLNSAGEIIQLTAIIYHVFDATVAEALSPRLRSTIGESQAITVVGWAREHKEAKHRTLHSLVAVGSWAALETLIADVCTETLQAEPQWLEAEAFRGLKLPPTIVLLDRHEQVNIIAEMAFSGGVAPTDDGKAKFERQLKMVGLDGAVPEDLAKGLIWANAVRNIIMHNGGFVDSKFLARCPDSGYAVGDAIKLDHGGCADIILGLQTYTSIVLNRLRMNAGLRPLQCSQSPSNKFRDSFNQMYPDAIAAEQLTDESGGSSID
jgi:hypothetical protein